MPGCPLKGHTYLNKHEAFNCWFVKVCMTTFLLAAAVKGLSCLFYDVTQLTITCSKSTKETLENGVKYAQS